MIITYNTRIRSDVDLTEAVKFAALRMQRDIAMTLTEGAEKGGDIHLMAADVPAEGYILTVIGREIRLGAADDLGYIYGLLRISREFLKIHPFWFWSDQKFTKRKRITVPAGVYLSPSYAVRFRGWFINDEVLIHTWDGGVSAEYPWEMAMEALLRCGGNMVIPGTDKNSRKYQGLAVKMGLWVTHHHAEPLGAEMFSRAYPDKFPSYTQYPELFQGLWKDAVERQKDHRTVWNVGFRGQGDYPFWNNDPQYATPEARGKLISSLIRLQYDMIREQVPDAVCCTNLYGEIMELEQGGFLDLPADIIRIWADNGFGRMVSRRQNNHNPRVPALPKADPSGEKATQNGIYYHASFYDLQAANHITMTPNSLELIQSELDQAIRCGCTDYWIINASNIKPHIFILEYLSKYWREGSCDPIRHALEHARLWYGKAHAMEVAGLYRRYAQCTAKYGPHKDDHAGEQFYTYPVRMLATDWHTARHTEPCDGLRWFLDAPFAEQVRHYKSTCENARARFAELLNDCEAAAESLPAPEKRRLKDSLLLQVTVHLRCLTGACTFCEAYEAFTAGELKKAFLQVGDAAACFMEADKALRACEHNGPDGAPKWQGFYANECLSDVKFTAEVLYGLMSYIRALGDGPHYYVWMREALYSDEDLRISLITNMENHLSDKELYALMKEKGLKETTLFPGMLAPG